jgi:multisubunit Na+/H+ antiporter MnhC subunit
MESIVSDYNYWIYILLMMIGLYAMLAKNNLVKKVIGMSILRLHPDHSPRQWPWCCRSRH